MADDEYDPFADSESVEEGTAAAAEGFSTQLPEMIYFRSAIIPPSRVRSRSPFAPRSPRSPESGSDILRGGELLAPAFMRASRAAQCTWGGGAGGAGRGRGLAQQGCDFLDLAFTLVAACSF